MKAKATAADAVFFCFVALLLLAVLPLGSSRPWSALLSATLLGGLAVAWGLVVWRAPETAGVSLTRLRLPVALYTTAVVWGLVQCLPITPTAWANPLWSQAAVALGPVSPRISITPAAGIERTVHLAAVGLAFLIAVQVGRSSRRATALVEALGLGLGLVAAYGLVVYISGAETLFWMPKWAYIGDLTAVLVNRNHYATLAGIGLLCALAGLLRRWKHYGHREALRRVFSGRDLRTIGLAASVAASALALPLTHSRAGAAVTLLGVVMFVLLIGRRRWRTLVPWLTLTASVAVIVLVEINARLPEISVDTETRLRVWALSWQILQNQPWLGIGLGGFSDAFQAIRPVSVTQFWDRAHNAWLELMIELGVPAAFALFAAAGWAWVRCLSGALRRHRTAEIPALAAAVGLLIGAHSLVDFSIQIPAIAFIVAALLGIGTAQSWSSGLGRVVT